MLIVHFIKTIHMLMEEWKEHCKAMEEQTSAPQKETSYTHKCDLLHIVYVTYVQTVPLSTYINGMTIGYNCIHVPL
jgi:hypothetical protein